MAYGVEIVAFVSSVGKIHIPDSAGDDDLLSEEYLELMHGLTREKVDENTVRCPHQETAELMEEVRPLVLSRSSSYSLAEPPSRHMNSEFTRPRPTTTRSAVPSPA